MNELLREYHKARAWQREIYGPGPTHIRLPDGQQWCAEHTGGGAAAGFHAVAAYQSARLSVHQRKCRVEDARERKARSRAAKRGWKQRRALATVAIAAEKRAQESA